MPARRRRNSHTNPLGLRDNRFDLGESAPMRIMGIVALCGALGGCVGPLVPVTHIDDSTAIELDPTVRTFAATESPPNAPVFGPITATSCKNKIWDKDATAEDATNQLRLMARQRGGNAVGHRTCENQEGTSLAKNCWASITCTGTGQLRDSKSVRRAADSE